MLHLESGCEALDVPYVLHRGLYNMDSTVFVHDLAVSREVGELFVFFWEVMGGDHVVLWCLITVSMVSDREDVLNVEYREC